MIINLEAKILKNNPEFMGKTVEDLMAINWSFISVKGEKKYEKGKLIGRYFYSKMEDDGSFLEENKTLSILNEDVKKQDGTIDEIVINNTTYIKIKTTKTIILDDSLVQHSQEEIDSHSSSVIKRVEKSKLYRLRRESVIYNMKSKNVNTSIEGSVKFLSSHYQDVITKYINDGTFDFRDAILSESNQNVLNHLYNKLLIGYDGVIGATSGTTPLYYQLPDGQGGTFEPDLKMIILNTIDNWND